MHEIARTDPTEAALLAACVLVVLLAAIGAWTITRALFRITRWPMSKWDRRAQHRRTMKAIRR